MGKLVVILRELDVTHVEDCRQAGEDMGLKLEGGREGGTEEVHY